MKFLSKSAQSQIFLQNILYQKNNSVNNKRLTSLLLKEQKGFCAYTEKYIEPLDSAETEHVNSSIKYNDNYYNYYAVIRNANLYKQDEKYPNASFFENLFFQNSDEFNSRISFSNNMYYEIDERDAEAKNFIDFINFNHPTLSEQRSKHINRLKKTFADAKYEILDIIEYFKKHKEELSHITAIEHEFEIDLSEIIND
jgi:DNA repair ATPase RecN